MTVPLADENRELVLQGLGGRERKGLLGREQERQRKHARREGGCTFLGGTYHGRHRRRDLHGGRHFKTKRGGGRGKRRGSGVKEAACHFWGVVILVVVFFVSAMFATSYYLAPSTQSIFLGPLLSPVTVSERVSSFSFLFPCVPL